MHSSRMRTVRCSARRVMGGGCVCPGGVCLPGGGSVSAQGGVMCQGGTCPGGVYPGGCLPRGVCIPACTGADTLPRVERILDTHF